MTCLPKFQRVSFWPVQPNVLAVYFIQLLPRNSEEEQERVDQDLWPRLTMLTETPKIEELTDLEASRNSLPFQVQRRSLLA